MNGMFNIGDIVLDNWKLTKLIGEGSFGRVYEASREDFGKTYKAALKIITIPKNQGELRSVMADGLDNESATSYFKNIVEELVEEFSLMSMLKGNSNIVSYEDHRVIRHTEGVGWDIIIRMELLTPLLDYIAGKKYDIHMVLRLGIDICRALEVCQKFSIIHRDIKPENIFVSDLDDFKLGDFGIARTAEKTTNNMTKIGTHTYMAPEILRGRAYGPSVDIYALGIVLYRMMNENRTPFLPDYPAPITHSDREVAVARRANGERFIPPKNNDQQLFEIILRACTFDVNDRYPSPVQMRMELEAILSGGSRVGVPAQGIASGAVASGAGNEQPILNQEMLSNQNVSYGNNSQVDDDATLSVLKNAFIVCKNCGKQLDSKVLFCTKCGTSTANAHTPPQPQQKPNIPPQNVQQGNAPPSVIARPGMQQAAPFPQPQNTPPKQPQSNPVATPPNIPPRPQNIPPKPQNTPPPYTPQGNAPYPGSTHGGPGGYGPVTTPPSSVAPKKNKAFLPLVIIIIALALILGMWVVREYVWDKNDDDGAVIVTRSPRTTDHDDEIDDDDNNETDDTGNNGGTSGNGGDTISGGGNTGNNGVSDVSPSDDSNIVEPSPTNPEVIVPNLLGGTRTQIDSVFQDLNLTPSYIEVSDDTPEGTVVFIQSLGQSVPVSTIIEVHISSGPSNSERLNTLLSGYNTTSNLAVAVIDLNTGTEYGEGNAESRYVAAGFYAGIHVITYPSNPTLSNSMLASMSNESANQLIREYGGFFAINGALATAGFNQTTYDRNFGDTSASGENYTSARDAVKALGILYSNGNYSRMAYDITRDGFWLPSGVTINAHRGQGIGNAYNVFAVISSGNVTYGIAIMTSHPGRTTEQARIAANTTISNVIAEVHSIMIG